MAYKKNTEHAFLRIGKDMKAGRIPSLVLLCGSEEYLVDFYADALIRKYVDKTCEALDLVVLGRDIVTAGRIEENMETLPLMSERKVVYLPGFVDSNGKLPKAFSERQDELKRLFDYAESIRESSGMLLLMTADAQDDERGERALRSSALFRNISEAARAGKAAVYDFGPLDNGQLRAFIEKRFHAAGKEFRPGIPALIAKEAGYGSKNIDYGLYDLENDLRKIIAHSGDEKEITPADVSSVITINPENNVFAMLDAIGKKRKDEAFRLLHNLLQDGSSEFQLLAMITGQLEIMLIACEMKAGGMSLAEIQKTLNKSEHIHEFRTRKALEAGSRFGQGKLKAVLLSAYDVEVNIKTGLMPGPLALEYFIAGI